MSLLQPPPGGKVLRKWTLGLADGGKVIAQIESSHRKAGHYRLLIIVGRELAHTRRVDSIDSGSSAAKEWFNAEHYNNQQHLDTQLQLALAG